ncbi:hypothetical protein Cni_G01782 [Canna indica]|uniref:MULE transposase domain-containing protein n=1 Tax=Canna indica TaxID=4628 RepID=A0AAQ3JQ54_9LILI|nr:hypothetical protein Cni_G01782 [Canna indica]
MNPNRPQKEDAKDPVGGTWRIATLQGTIPLNLYMGGKIVLRPKPQYKGGETKKLWLRNHLKSYPWIRNYHRQHLQHRQHRQAHRLRVHLKKKNKKTRGLSKKSVKIPRKGMKIKMTVKKPQKRKEPAQSEEEVNLDGCDFPDSEDDVPDIFFDHNFTQVEEEVNNMFNDKKESVNDRKKEPSDESEYEPSDHLDTTSESKNEQRNKKKRKKQKFATFNEKTDFHGMVELIVGMCFNNFKVCRAKQKIMLKLQEKAAEKFTKLWNYSVVVKKYNPDSNCKVDLNNGLFKRFYVCLGALKTRFKAACRPIICIDGCFLKGPYGGQLLCAIANDGNDNMYPIAWAAMKVECYDSWKWFMYYLLEDIGSIEENDWTFMSDQQKSLESVLEELGADHRICVRHLYANFKKSYHSKTLKDELWNAARATTFNSFKICMERIKNIDQSAYD